MRHFATTLTALLLVSALASFAEARDIEIDSGSYGAIAYSPSTGTYGYSHNYRSRRSAEQAALGYCDADDARVVAWVNFGFAALVKADDGSWGAAASYGEGSTNLEAINRARRACREHTDSPIRTVLVISSDGQYVAK